MTFPASAPFGYTAIPDFVFDQVMTFTVMNTLRDNVDNVASALEIEHYFDGDDGTHRRIVMRGNSILNPTARQGNLFWWDGGDETNYNQPGVDTDQALNYNPANFIPQEWTDVVGRGPLWTILPAASGSLISDLSEAIPIGAAFIINLSGQLLSFNYVAGNYGFDVVCYDNANVFLGIIAVTSINADTPDTVFNASGTTLANTAYVRVRKWIDGAAQASQLWFKKLQLTDSPKARPYNDDVHVNSYVSIHYKSTAGQQFSSGFPTVINFEDQVYDDPNGDRVTVGVNWNFTAERFMRLNIKTRVLFQQSSIWGGRFVILDLFKTPSGGAAALYKNIDIFEAQVNPLVNYGVGIKGSAQITLNKGDSWDLRLEISSGTPPNQPLVTDGRVVWVDAEEI